MTEEEWDSETGLRIIRPELVTFSVDDGRYRPPAGHPERGDDPEPGDPEDGDREPRSPTPSADSGGAAAVTDRGLE